MSASRAAKRRPKKGSGGAKARNDAKKGSTPDVPRPGRIKPVREDEEPAAENDEEDD